MRVISSQSMIFSCILSLLVLASFSTSAFASPSFRKATGGCSHLHVHLNGKQPATKTCLDNQASTTSISEPDCGIPNPELTLWWDAKRGGANVCFSGEGSTDLVAYPRPALGLCHNGAVINCTWDKNASSYEMWGANTFKTIYTGIAGNGTPYADKSSEGDLSNTPVGEDNASSISIESCTPTTC